MARNAGLVKELRLQLQRTPEFHRTVLGVLPKNLHSGFLSFLNSPACDIRGKFSPLFAALKAEWLIGVVWGCVYRDHFDVEIDVSDLTIPVLKPDYTFPIMLDVRVDLLTVLNAIEQTPLNLTRNVTRLRESVEACETHDSRGFGTGTHVVFTQDRWLVNTPVGNNPGITLKQYLLYLLIHQHLGPDVPANSGGTFCATAIGKGREVTYPIIYIGNGSLKATSTDNGVDNITRTVISAWK